MLIIGAKGLAKELLQLSQELNLEQNLYFYDDVSNDVPEKLYDKYTIITSQEMAKSLFLTNPAFTLGIGKPQLRKKFCEKFEKLGGQLTSIVSKEAYVGSDDVHIAAGANIMAGVNISNGVRIGKAVLAYYNVIITHDVKIGEFVELSPGCKLLGRVHIEDLVHVGAGAIILPDLKIGTGAIIGAGAVVTKNVNAGDVVVGNPARKILKNI